MNDAVPQSIGLPAVCAEVSNNWCIGTPLSFATLKAAGWRRKGSGWRRWWALIGVREDFEPASDEGQEGQQTPTDDDASTADERTTWSARGRRLRFAYAFQHYKNGDPVSERVVSDSFEPVYTTRGTNTLLANLGEQRMVDGSRAGDWILRTTEPNNCRAIPLIVQLPLSVVVPTVGGQGARRKLIRALEWDARALLHGPPNPDLADQLKQIVDQLQHIAQQLRQQRAINAAASMLIAEQKALIAHLYEAMECCEGRDAL